MTYTKIINGNIIYNCCIKVITLHQQFEGNKNWNDSQQWKPTLLSLMLLPVRITGMHWCMHMGNVMYNFMSWCCKRLIIFVVINYSYCFGNPIFPEYELNTQLPQPRSSLHKKINMKTHHVFFLVCNFWALSYLTAQNPNHTGNVNTVVYYCKIYCT